MMMSLTCGSIMLWGCVAAGETGALYKINDIMRKKTLCRNIDATSQDISQEVKALTLMGLLERQ